MKSIFKKLGLVPTLLIAAGLLHSGVAASQQPVVCDTATAAACNTGVNPGDGTQGDVAWVAFGKINANFASIPSQLFNDLPLPIVYGGTGQNSATAAINALLPPQGASSGDCLGTNGSVASWIACGSGGSSAWSTITGGTNTGAAMLVGTGASLAPTGSGTITANAVVSGTALGTPTSINLSNATLLPLGSGVTGILGTSNGGLGAASFAAANLPVWSGTNTAGDCVYWINPTTQGDSGAPCGGGGGSNAFNALTSGTNVGAAMIVGSGASLSMTGTGTISASSVTGFAAASGKTFTANNSLTFAGTDSTTFTFPTASDTVVGVAATQTLTNKSISSIVGKDNVPAVLTNLAAILKHFHFSEPSARHTIRTMRDPVVRD